MESLNNNIKNLANLSSNDTEMNDETFLGVFDADAGILLGLECANGVTYNPDFKLDPPLNDSEQKKPFKLPFAFSVFYDFSQSNSKTDLVLKMAEKFGGDPRVEEERTVFRVRVGSLVGQKIRVFLKKNKPRYPGRYFDYLLSEVVLRLIDDKVHLTRQGAVTIIALTMQNYRNKDNNHRKYERDFWFHHIQPSAEEKAKGLEKAEKILHLLHDKHVSKLEKALPTTVFSLDYIRGTHFGDGGLTVALTWKPNKNNRLRSEPEWTISGENKAYCSAFINSFEGKGNVNKAGPGFHKFRLTGIKNSLHVINLFKEVWMPEYKKTQLATFSEAIGMLKAREHFTPEGIVALVNLVYDMSEKGSRQYKKEDYIEWGLAWVAKRSKKPFENLEP